MWAKLISYIHRFIHRLQPYLNSKRVRLVKNCPKLSTQQFLIMRDRFGPIWFLQEAFLFFFFSFFIIITHLCHCGSSINIPMMWGWKYVLIIIINYFYRTRVRSLGMLVSNSLTNSLTNCSLVNLIDVALACEDANSKLVEVVTVAHVDAEDQFVTDFGADVWS